MARITIEIPDELATGLAERAAAEGMTQADLIQEALLLRAQGWDPFRPDAERLARMAAGAAELDAGQGVPDERAASWLAELAAGRAVPPPR